MTTETHSHSIIQPTAYERLEAMKADLQAEGWQIMCWHREDVLTNVTEETGSKLSQDDLDNILETSLDNVGIAAINEIISIVAYEFERAAAVP